MKKGGKMEAMELCPLCEEESKIDKVRLKREFKVRGEPIDIEYEAIKCNKCGEEFIDSKSEDDPLAIAYRIYRKKHNMLQPEEIKELRKKYGITQGELSQLLGLGGATLSRYENGSLQDKTHDRQFKLIADPRNMLKLVRENKELLGEKRAASLIHSLDKLVKDEYPLGRCLEEIFLSDEKSIFTGFQSFDIDKFFQSILYFCKDGLLKTKINKYLFYADFKHFKEYSISITGARYVHLPLGPVPDNYNIFLATLVNDGSLEVEEIFYSEPDWIGEMYTTKEKFFLSIFSDSEIKVLSTIKENFKKFTARAISEYSHQEKGYQETSSGEPISYEYAESLKI